MTGEAISANLSVGESTGADLTGALGQGILFVCCLPFQVEQSVRK